MSRYFVPITQPQIRNSLLDFSAVNQGLNAIGQAQQNETRNALMRDQMAMQKDQQQWARGRAEQQDARQAAEQGGKMAMAIMQMPDDDPAKASAWQQYLKRYGDGNHSAEELSHITGPKIAAAAFGYADNPMERQTAQARLDLLRAQTARANRPDQGPDAPSNVREWQYYQSLPKEQQSEYLRLRRPSENRLVGDSIINRGTGEVVSNVGDAIAAGKRQEVIGKAQGEGVANMPKLKSSFKSAEIADKNLFRSLAKAETLAGPWTTGFAGSITQYVKGTPSSDLAITLRQVKASLGFGSLQQMRDNSPTGGALGQVTERELELLQNAEAALDQAQSEDEFREALAYLREIKTEYAQLRREAYETDVARFGQAAVPNPETGAKSQGGADADGWMTIDGVRIREKR